MNHDDTLYKLIDRIREHITRADKQYALIRDPEKWLSLASAIYIIEDTASAMEYYLDCEFPIENGGKYLMIYGLLQACFLQQDAMNSISSSLFNRKIKYSEDYPELYAIRIIRNQVAGHPIKHADKEYIQINQSTVEKSGFEYLVEETTRGKAHFKYVDITEVIQAAKQCAHDVLSKVVEELDAEETKFIEMYKDIKMQDIFAVLNFAREKVLGGTIFKETEYSHTKRMVKECEDELSRRYGSIEAIGEYKYKLSDIHALFDLIDNGLGEVYTETVSQIEHRLFELLFVKLGELYDLCAETDRVFAGEKHE